MDVTKDLKEGNKTDVKGVLGDLRDLLRKTISLELGISDIKRDNAGLENGYLYVVPQNGLSVKQRVQSIQDSWGKGTDWVFYGNYRSVLNKPLLSVRESKEQFSGIQSFSVEPLSDTIKKFGWFLIFPYWKDVKNGVEKAIIESPHNKGYRLELDTGYKGRYFT
jgi:hypothetical protein